MAKMRVHELAKEFGMKSKELLGYLEEMKIPAKSHASSLEEAYVDKVRKELAPIIKEREDKIKAQQEEAKRREEEEKRKKEEEAERQRIEAEKRAEERREIERKQREEAEAQRKKEEEERKAKEEERKREEEKRKKEEQEKQKDNAPTALPSINSLLDQIEQEQERLDAKKEEKRRKKKEQEKALKKKKEEQAKKEEKKAEAQPQEKSSKKKKTKKKSAQKKDKEKEEEPEKIETSKVLAEARKAVARAQAQSGTGKRQKRKAKREREQAKQKRLEERRKALAEGLDPDELGTIKITEGSSVAEVAEALDVPSNDIVKRLLLLGTPLNVNQAMDNDLIELVAQDLEADIKIISPQEESSFHFYDREEDLKPRDPVVTVMGHVDHGKTSLLDAIRDTGVAGREAGGITQAIGASVANIHDRKITFIDTPGHEAFTAMRARGARVTDVVILVVAADDGVMPQTIEAINHAKAADVPIVVAINKIDREEANPDRVRSELAEHGVISEEWGGDTMFVEVSAKERINIDELLETVILQADVLELKANPDTFASGYVIEAELDKGRGAVATVVVNRGTLHVGDTIVAGTAYGRVRAMLDEHGENLEEVKPSEPAGILGLDSVPAAGDEFRVFTDERDARDLAEERALKQRIVQQNRAARHISFEKLFDEMKDGQLRELNLIVKADVQGSIEALADSLDKMDQSEVKINVIHSAVGGITQTDVSLADASNAVIVGFNVRPTAQAKADAQNQEVEIRTYRVIYDAIDDINAARVGMLKPTIEERDTGIAEVRDLFKVPKVGVAAGCYVTDGEINRNDKVRVVRDGTVVYEGEIASLRRFTDDVKSVKSGYECGIGIDGFQDIKVGDLIEGYEIVEVARKE